MLVALIVLLSELVVFAILFVGGIVVIILYWVFFHDETISDHIDTDRPEENEVILNGERVTLLSNSPNPNRLWEYKQEKEEEDE